MQHSTNRSLSISAEHRQTQAVGATICRAAFRLHPPYKAQVRDSILEHQSFFVGSDLGRTALPVLSVFSKNSTCLNVLVNSRFHFLDINRCLGGGPFLPSPASVTVLSTHLCQVSSARNRSAPARDWTEA